MADSDNTKTIFDKLYWPILVILLLITIVLYLPSGQTQPDNAGTFATSPSQFAGSALTNSCVTHDNTGMHYHTTLFVSINGSEVDIPPNIGIPSDDCMYALHTHDTTGNVHIELPADYEGNTPTLHDLFAIWGYDLNKTSLLNQTGTVSLTINEESSDLSDKLVEGYRMADDDVIELSLT